jgi:RNA polymerase sigma factor (TIGR02999 family)
MGEVTTLLEEARAGKPPVFERLFELLYTDLKRLAHAKLRGGEPCVGLDTTALVHESFLRLVKIDRLEVNDRPHFMAYAARVMRSVIVDLVRKRSAQRRGGVAEAITLDTGLSEALPAGNSEILAIHEALEALAAIDERLVRVVEMRYFVGLSTAEIAAALGVTSRTVERDWEKARSFLYCQIKQG